MWNVKLKRKKSLMTGVEFFYKNLKKETHGYNP
jgi:hypothetical protein